MTSRLNTLKFSDNNITLAEGAFNGLEQSLKNLNLKVSIIFNLFSLFHIVMVRVASLQGCHEL